MSLERAEALLQKAYNLDTGQPTGQLNLPYDLFAVGVMDVHYVYYNGGLAVHPEMIQHLQHFPNGQFVNLLRALRDARMPDYPRQTLNSIYGLPIDD